MANPIRNVTGTLYEDSTQPVSIVLAKTPAPNEETKRREEKFDRDDHISDKLMERNSSFGLSWADQWDYNGDPSPTSQSKSGGGGGGGGNNMKKGVEKTKAITSTGLRKVKEGTASGFQWIKDKYSKRKQKN